MRVLFVGHDCVVGGAETFTLALSAALQRAGHHCELLFLRRGPLEAHIPKNTVVHFGGLAEVLRIARRGGFDVVHARTSDWLSGVSAVRQLGARLVVTSHGFVSPAWTTNTCDALVGCSRWLAEEQQRLTNIAVQVVMNGIDTERFRPELPQRLSAGAPVVAWVGRGVDPRKGLARFARLAAALHRRGCRIWLGEPFGREEVSRRDPESVALLTSVAERWSRVPVDEMPGFYRDVAATGGCLVSTAEWEGLPLTLIEAQACGCPVIGPDVRGTNECVDPQHGGQLYPFDAPDDEVAGMVWDAIADGEGMRDRRHACAEYARTRFGLDRMAAEYAAIYRAAQAGPTDARTRAASSGASLPRRWQQYLEHRWSVGLRQYEAARELAASGEWALARAAIRESVSTSPTIYARPSRFGQLLRTLVTYGVAASS